MRVLIVSDTHGRHTSLDRALKEAGEIDMFIHLGDVEGGEDYIEAVVECEKHMIRGNNDFFLLSSGGRRVLDRKEESVYYSWTQLLCFNGDRADSGGRGCKKCGTLLCSVTPIARIFEERDGITVLNPGSLSFPRQEGRKSSYMILETDGEEKYEFVQHFL